MTELPAATPLSMPVPDPMVAVPVLTLVHVPPEVASVSVVIPPTHATGVPVIAAGTALIVSVAVLKQPPGIVYVITGVPDDKVVTIPVAEPIVAIAGLLLVHVPPAVEDSV